MAQKISLLCRKYDVYRAVDELTEINVSFILPIAPNDTENMAEALKRIEIFLSGKVDFVRSDKDKPRCFYCGSLQDLELNMCSQCGAPL